MRGAILCYSVTGNTSLVAQRVARAMPFTFEVVDITALPQVQIESFDVVGFAVPTDFWGISERVSAYLAGLPPQQERPAFVMNTFGGASGKALVRLWEAVEARGFRVAAGHSMHMPDSYPPLIAQGFIFADPSSTRRCAAGAGGATTAPSRAIHTETCAGTPFYAGPAEALRDRMLGV